LSRFKVRMGNSPICTPSLAGSTRNAVTPLCFLARSTDATTKKSPAWAAWEMKTLVPERRQPPSAFSAVVRRLPRSVPPPGSVRQAEVSTSPAASRGSHVSFCASVPWRRIDPPTSEFVTETTDATTQSTRASSSQISP
jgi:hypothetical protein